MSEDDIVVSVSRSFSPAPTALIKVRGHAAEEDVYLMNRRNSPRANRVASTVIREGVKV